MRAPIGAARGLPSSLQFQCCRPRPDDPSLAPWKPDKAFAEERVSEKRSEGDKKCEGGGLTASSSCPPTWGMHCLAPPPRPHTGCPGPTPAWLPPAPQGATTTTCWWATTASLTTTGRVGADWRRCMCHG